MQSFFLLENLPAFRPVVVRNSGQTSLLGGFDGKTAKASFRENVIWRCQSFYLPCEQVRESDVKGLFWFDLWHDQKFRDLNFQDRSDQENFKIADPGFT
jgi:hypothetical protein